jgi:hypothetical protein
LNKLAESLCALFVVIKLQKSKLGRSDRGADKLIDLTLIFGEEKQLSIFSNMLLKLLFELYNMLKNQFLLRCILPVGDRRRFFVLELSASLDFFIDHNLPALEKL